MDFDRDWHTFSLDAEVDAYGTSRIAGAHNRLREENARLRQRLEELERERDAAWAVRDAGWVQTEDALTRMRTAEAKLARCVEALNYGLLLTSSWSDIRTHNWRNGVRAALAAVKP